MNIILSLDTMREIVYGSRLKEFLCDYCVVDIETTDLDTTFCEIIEITALRVRNNKIQDRFTSLIKPVGQIPEHIQQLTGITNEMVTNAPNIDEIMPRFIEFVNNDVVVGHNVTFDLRCISRWSFQLLKRDFLNDYIDTLWLARKVFPEFQNHKLPTMVELLSLPPAKHRSEADCIATKVLYDVIRTTALERNIDCFHSKRKPKPKIKPADILPTVSSFDTSHPLYGKVCVVTGTLPMSRTNIMQLIVDYGGINANSVTSKTNILIVGDPDSTDEKSSKQRKAEELIQSGQQISIIDKNEFIRMLNL